MTRRGLKSRIALRLPLAALAVVAAPLRAQAPRRTRENLNAWATIVGDVQLSPRWFVDYDFSLRRSGPLREWQQLFPRASVRYRLNPTVQLNVGVARPETYPYGKLPVAFRFPERRIWEQVMLSQSAGRVALTHRYRVEQRWTGRVALVGGKEEVQNWVRTNRARYRIGALVPLQGKSTENGEFYANLNGEVLMNWGANVTGNVFDQYRANAMLGYRHSRRLRLEAGYLEHLVQKPNGWQLERNHTLAVAVVTSQSLLH